MTDYRTAGKAVFARMMGEDVAERMERHAQSGEYLSGTAELGLDFAFGAVWARPGLEMKQRSLVLIGILIALRQYAELRNHVLIAVRNGLTATEIEEAVIQCIPYVGFPAVASAMTPVIEGLRAAGIGTAMKTPEERGML